MRIALFGGSGRIGSLVLVREAVKARKTTPKGKKS